MPRTPGSSARSVTRALYRDAGPSVSVSRSAQLEHRAYLLLMAARAGVPVSDVVIAVRGGSQDMALLALLEPDGVPLSTISADDITDSTLDDLWANTTRLHRSRLTHGQLVPSNVMVRRRTGRLRSSTSPAGSAGAPDRALPSAIWPTCCRRPPHWSASTVRSTAAMRSLGTDGLAALLPLLETAALSPAARRAVPGSKKQLKELREAGASAVRLRGPEAR